ncbi:predicted 23S rRNA methylase [Metamycoplasma cloacale]|uniref:TlyA family RNA methyltransferase n=1 Tax=Metamycoplasma cloacale TaxID=92401 RepID=A0A2Z4LM10_9BACT|nr:TlyA family RNA methyltransferase [Metamycoplasma cloacale]AWX42734.1 TlyA family RNA methyltransferase [Metamycoplasma cloacale]VEU79452.1 predicted 23S rRNA methylase [Metamycoplasma cloacale]
MKKTLLELITEFEQQDKIVVEKWIRSGYVLVNSEKVFLPSLKFETTNFNYSIIKPDKYVSRASYKLLAAIKEFNLKIDNLVCLDIGSSTGGFVQVLLENKAKKVYAVDCGTNQLDYKLRVNPNVKVYENTNLKNLVTEMFEEDIDFVTCDVSFISLKHVFKVCQSLLKPSTQLMLLIKPQFEAISKYVEKGGYVNPIHHEYIINKVLNYATTYGFKNLAIKESPIVGKTSENIEYISLFIKE